jgi:DNA-binding transcriptional ArsR family regulator
MRAGIVAPIGTRRIGLGNSFLLTLHFRGGEMTAGDIADRFACSWPTTTRHLRVLECARLVSVQKRGRERICELEKERLLAVAGGWLDWFRGDRAT